MRSGISLSSSPIHHALELRVNPPAVHCTWHRPTTRHHSTSFFHPYNPHPHLRLLHFFATLTLLVLSLFRSAISSSPSPKLRFCFDTCDLQSTTLFVELSACFTVLLHRCSISSSTAATDSCSSVTCCRSQSASSIIASHVTVLSSLIDPRARQPPTLQP